MELTAARSATVEKMARAGLAAKGVIYCILGLIGFMAAFEIGGQRNDEASREGTLLFIRNFPGGTLLLGALVLGILCYSCWRIAEAIGARKKDLKDWRKPLRYVFSALSYLAVAFAASQVLLYKYRSGGGSHWSANYLQSTGGKIFVAAVALAMAGTGIYQLWYGWSKKYKDHISSSIYSSRAALLLVSGKIGYTARGLVWLVISWMLFKAVWNARPSEAGDTSKAFSFIESATHGSILLAGLGLGLVAYGIFSFLRAGFENFK